MAEVHAVSGLFVAPEADSTGSAWIGESGVLDPDVIRRAVEHIRRGPHLVADSLPPVHPDLWPAVAP